MEDGGWNTGETQFLRDDFRAEIAFADEQRDDENSRSGDSGEDAFDMRFLFPERLMDPGKYVPAAQFRRVLVNRRGGLVV